MSVPKLGFRDREDAPAFALLIIAVFTSSFDILFNVVIGGYTFRLCQVALMPLMLFMIIEACMGRKQPIPIGSKWLLAWFAVMAVFMFRSPNLKNGIYYELFLLFCILTLFVFSKYIKTKGNFLFITRVYVLSFVFLSLVGFVQMVLYAFGINFFVAQEWTHRFARANGFTYEPSYYATYMLMGFLMLAYLVEKGDFELFSKRTTIIFLAIVSAALIVASSRMGILMMILWVGFRFVRCLVGSGKSARFKKLAKIYLRIILVLIACGAICVLGIIVSGVNVTFFMTGFGFGAKPFDSIDARAGGLGACLDIFFKSPIFGYSLGGVDPMLAQVQGIEYVQGANGESRSTIGDLLVGCGIVGLIPLIIAFKQIITGATGLKSHFRSSSDLQRAMVWALVGELIILCMNQNILRMYVWIHIAMVCTCWNFYKAPATHGSTSSRFLINGDLLCEQEHYGIQRSTLEMLKQFDGMAAPGTVALAVAPGWKSSFGFKNIECIECASIKHRRLALLLWQKFGFVRYAHKHGYAAVDLLLALPVGGADIVAIYDCIRELFPQNANTLKSKIARLLYIACVKRNVRKSKLIIANSEYTKRDIMKMYKCDSGKIRIVFCGWQHIEKIEEDDSILEELGLVPGAYCFSLGSRIYHKNFKWVVEAARQNPNYTFVVSGTRIQNTSDAYLEQESPANMIFTGYVSDARMKALMRNCKAFIQPSLYEGFGIPPMEAMSVGAECIVSNAASLPEIYAEAVHYINPIDYSSINIDELLTEDVQDASSVLNRFSWKASAVQFLDALSAYDGCCSSDGNVPDKGRIGVILVNYCGEQDTYECIESIRSSTYTDVKIYVLDNASPDGSGASLAKKYAESTDVQVKLLPENIGFGLANNAGMQMAQKDGCSYLLLLNNDTVIADDMISLLAEQANANTITVPLMLFHSEPECIWYAGGESDPLKVFTHEHEGEIATDIELVDHDVVFATGCCIMLPAQAYVDTGGFSPDYFLYWEDADWSIRLMRAGYTIRFVAEAKLWHKISASTGGSKSPLVGYYSLRNRFYTIRKYNLGSLAMARTYLALLYARIAKKPNQVFADLAWRDYKAGNMGISDEVAKKK